MAGNVQVMHIRHLTANCTRYVAGMTGMVFVGYDWPGIEAVCRMSGIELDRYLVSQLRSLENMDLKYLNQKEAAANG